MKKPQTEQLWSAEFIGCGLSSCLLYMSQYILIATLPLVITGVYGGTALEAGLAMTYFQIGTILCRPFAGEIIDGLNKRVVLWSATGIFALIMGAFYFVRSLELIFILRLLHGLIFALGTTAVAAVAVLVLPKSRKGEGIGYFSVFVNIAMVIGPFLGLTIFSAWGSDALFGFLTVCGLLCIYAANREKLPEDLALPQRKGSQSWHWTRLIEKDTLPWTLMGLFISFTYSGVLVFVPIMMTDLGMPSLASWFFVIFALTIVVSRPMVGKAYDNIGPLALIYPGFLIYGGGILLLSLTGGLYGVIASAIVIGLGYGAISPAFQTLAIQAAKPERAGAATATYFLSLDIGVGLGATLLSLLITAQGFTQMYLLNGAIALLGLAVFHFILRPRQRKALRIEVK